MEEQIVTETISTNSNAGDVLVVTSKIKKYIKDTADMNTSGDVPAVISKKIEELLNQAIERAKADGRKTVKDRDF